MQERPSKYPDISDILARKAAGRRQRAALSFAEKLDIFDASESVCGRSSRLVNFADSRNPFTSSALQSV
jgi:hypothetical protein